MASSSLPIQGWVGQCLADPQGAEPDPPFNPQGYEPLHRFLLRLGQQHVWVHHASDDVERFKQDLDEGLIEGIPPAISDPEWLTYYLVEWHMQF